MKEAAAYNNSIYLMVGMPYLLLTGLGFMAYRLAKQAKKNTGTDAAWNPESISEDNDPTGGDTPM